MKTSRILALLVLALPLAGTFGNSAAVADPRPEAGVNLAVRAAATDLSLGQCMDRDKSVKLHSENACVKALTTFLHYTINYRGYGPICAHIDLGGALKPGGTFTAKAKRHLMCYQHMVNFNVENNPDWVYQDALVEDGTAAKRDFRVMVTDTCRHDSRFLGPDGPGDFGNRWFCK